MDRHRGLVLPVTATTSLELIFNAPILWSSLVRFTSIARPRLPSFSVEVIVIENERLTIIVMAEEEWIIVALWVSSTRPMRRQMTIETGWWRWRFRLSLMDFSPLPLFPLSCCWCMDWVWRLKNQYESKDCNGLVWDSTKSNSYMQSDEDEDWRGKERENTQERREERIFFRNY